MPNCWRRAIDTWGSTAVERALAFPCDRYLPDAHDNYFRAVTVEAPAQIVFRWLCQLKVAPYSYDWIDNRGRRSPSSLVSGAEDLAIGQRVMRIFRLAEFEQGRHLTLFLDARHAEQLFGRIAVSYVVLSIDAGCSRLNAKLCVCYPQHRLGGLTRWLLPWGDWFMMRKQLLTLKCRAEGKG